MVSSWYLVLYAGFDSGDLSQFYKLAANDDSAAACRDCKTASLALGTEELRQQGGEAGTLIALCIV